MENQENLNELQENETNNQNPTPIDNPTDNSDKPTDQHPSPPRLDLNEEIKNLISGELKKAITEAVSQAYIKGRNDVIDEEMSRLGILENIAGDTATQQPTQQPAETSILNSNRRSIWDL